MATKPPGAPSADRGPTSTPTTAGAAAPFVFPREYHFPPFFTRQTRLATHHAQQTKWAALVLAYARHHRVFRLALSSAADSELFHNARLGRRLAPADVHELLDFMGRDGTAEYAGGSGGDTGTGGGGDVVLLYWRKPQEWATLVEQYVEDTGQKGSVLTVYELTEGEGTRSTG